MPDDVEYLRLWPTIVLVGAAFVLVFNGTNFLTSEFMVSEWSHNRFFAGMYPGGFFEEDFRQTPLWRPDMAGLQSVLIAFGVSCLMTLIAVRVGGWLRRLVR